MKHAATRKELKEDTEAALEAVKVAQRYIDACGRIVAALGAHINSLSEQIAQSTIYDDEDLPDLPSDLEPTHTSN